MLNYRKVELTFKQEPTRYFSIKEISELSGVEYKQTQQIIHKAFKVGFLKRKEYPTNQKNCFGRNQTRYMTIYSLVSESKDWFGLYKCYNDIQMQQ